MASAQPRRISDLRNLGPASERWLSAVGICTPEDLAEVGAVEAYRRVRENGPDSVNLMLLYALEGALLDVDCLRMPEEMKAGLRAELDVADA